MPALDPDVGVIHAQRADRHGNVQLWGIIGVQKEAVLAARRSLVTVEEIVDELEPRARRDRAARPGWSRACAEVPGGAHPSYAHGYYDARQRLLPGLGRDQPRPRDVRGVDRDGARRWRRADRDGSRLHRRRDDDRGRRPRAARRHGRASSASACPAPPPTSPGARTPPTWCSIYESGTIGAKPDRAAAVDRRRRAGRDRRRRGQRAGDLQLLAAAGPHRRRLPRRRPDRPVRATSTRP